MRYWESIEKILKMFEAFGVETMVTKSAEDAYTYLMSSEMKQILEEYFMIALSEIMNGIYDCKESERDLLLNELLFCVFPGGSSNDLALDCFAAKNNLLICIQKMLRFQASSLDILDNNNNIDKDQKKKAKSRTKSILQLLKKRIRLFDRFDLQAVIEIAQANNYEKFPKPIGQILKKHPIWELEMELTKDHWKKEIWI
ncbi:hypothetical protein RFI_28947 [Reticulomyxa filosa]|uniref:Uncharacterized protein n=1 Tax=Reticulomyxa filosa TaxID=46433 RepID=X6M4A7_RETFI|nr:hypothetical protein RFI_28947 [Reticulomyxa filosa]|eukprot:ETO08441.1 hypothetical protein RFI_28947 [Reticulomyxa filosa]